MKKEIVITLTTLIFSIIIDLIIAELFKYRARGKTLSVFELNSLYVNKWISIAVINFILIVIQFFILRKNSRYKSFHLIFPCILTFVLSELFVRVFL